MRKAAEKTESFLIPPGFLFFKARRQTDSSGGDPGIGSQIKTGYEADGRWSWIHKFFVKRTMSSAIDGIIEHMKKAGVGSQHILYIVHARALDDAKKIQKMMEKAFEGLEIHILELSPVFVAQQGRNVWPFSILSVFNRYF